MVNEGLWVLKQGIFVVLIFLNLFVPLKFWIYYGFFAKFISVVLLSLQITIMNDSLLIISMVYVVPFKEASSCGHVVTLIVGYVLPIITNLAIFIYNFMSFASVCSPYLIINMLILIFIILLIAINLMRLRKVSGPVIATLWFTLIIGILNYSILASTPHTSCKVQTDGLVTSTVSLTDSFIDNTLSSLS